MLTFLYSGTRESSLLCPRDGAGESAIPAGKPLWLLVEEGHGSFRKASLSTPSAHLNPEVKASLPRHVAIIMDGNGRWAKQRHLPRIEGHRAGAESARVIIRTAGELGIK